MIDRRRFARLMVLGPLGAGLAGSAAAAPPWPNWAGAPSEEPAPDPITLAIDYEGAEALLTALERTSIGDADVDRLLTINGVAAMVDNTTKYLHLDTRAQFRDSLKAFAATRTEKDSHFNLLYAAGHAADARVAMAALKTDADFAAEVTAPVQRYRPLQGPLTVTMHCVVGGVSDNFVPDGDEAPEFFTAVDRSQSDVDGVKLIVTREIYRAMERTARSLVAGLTPEVFDPATAAPPVRLMTAVLDEGMATYVARDMVPKGDGPVMKAWQEAFRQKGGAMGANFALFDDLLKRLRENTVDWDRAYDLGLAGVGPALQFVGYQMAKALEAHHGRERIAGYFQEHPAAFFRDYMALWTKRTGDTPVAFAAPSEEYFASIG